MSQLAVSNRSTFLITRIGQPSPCVLLGSASPRSRSSVSHRPARSLGQLPHGHAHRSAIALRAPWVSFPTVTRIGQPSPCRLLGSVSTRSRASVILHPAHSLGRLPHGHAHRSAIALCAPWILGHVCALLLLPLTLSSPSASYMVFFT